MIARFKKNPGPRGPGAVSWIGRALLASVMDLQARRIRAAARIVVRRQMVRGVVGTAVQDRRTEKAGNEPRGNRLELFKRKLAIRKAVVRRKCHPVTPVLVLRSGRNPDPALAVARMGH